MSAHKTVFGFPRTRRLTESAQFDRVFAKPSKAARSGVLVLGCRNDQSKPRLGLAISKRTVRKAVARNRTKRLAREAFRHLQDQLGGVDLIVLSSSKLEEKDNPTLSGLLSRCFLDVAHRCKKL